MMVYQRYAAVLEIGCGEHCNPSVRFGRYRFVRLSSGKKHTRYRYKAADDRHIAYWRNRKQWQAYQENK